MRPKKKVLLYCQDEERLSRIAFVLWSKSYAVTTINTDLSILSVLEEWDGECSLVLAGKETDHCEYLISRLQPVRKRGKVGVIFESAAPEEMQRFLYNNTDKFSHSVDNEALMLMVKELCIKKRGPKTPGIWNYDEVTA